MNARTCLSVFTFCMFLLSSVSFAQGQTGSKELVRIKLSNFQVQVAKLAAEGHDIAGVNHDDQTVDVIVETKDKQALSQYGEIVYSATEGSKRVDDQYTDYDEAMDLLAMYAENYPELASLTVLGQSHEGRDIVALKISDNVEERELTEPAVLFNANHHAREVMTVEVIIDTADYLLSNYGSDEKVTHWVDNNEIWLIPVVNPDGLSKVFGGSSMWRKNTREGYGVDLNRNYPFNWDHCNGSSGSTSSDTYRGPWPGSEPEAKAVMRLVERVQPVFDISYHSYSELVLYPYGCQDQIAPTKDVLEGIGKDLAATLPKDSGSGTYQPGTPPEILYDADGGDMDWMYGAYNVLAYVIELNSSSQGFQPAYSWRQPTVEKLRQGWGFLLDRLEGSGVRGTLKDPNGNLLANFQLTIDSLSDDHYDSLNFYSKPDGTFHLVLKPGMYKLTSQWGEDKIEKDITVGADLLLQELQF